MAYKMPVIIDLTLFEDWFITLLYVRQKVGPKVMIGDNLFSHLRNEEVNACKENNIGFGIRHACASLWTWRSLS